MSYSVKRFSKRNYAGLSKAAEALLRKERNTLSETLQKARNSNNERMKKHFLRDLAKDPESKKIVDKYAMEARNIDHDTQLELIKTAAESSENMIRLKDKFGLIK